MRRSYAAVIGKDGSFRIDDVESGTYELIFVIDEPPANADAPPTHKPIPSDRREVTVPAIPGGAPTSRSTSARSHWCRSSSDSVSLHRMPARAQGLRMEEFHAEARSARRVRALNICEMLGGAETSSRAARC